MTNLTIGRVLKKKGISQERVVEILNTKYDLSISLSNFNRYSRQYICGDTIVWQTIKDCLEKEFGIKYKPTYWY